MSSSGENILVVGPSWVGDMVMSQALYIHLHRARPGVAIDVLAPPWSEPLLQRMPEVRNALSMPVGHGELGRGVEKVARQFGMSVLIARRLGQDPTVDDGRTEFRQMLQQSDVISLHCPLTDETHDLISAAELRLMKPTAMLINTARGGLVDSAALVSALNTGEISAAAIDVLPQEPPVDGNPLLDYVGDNLIVTPHIAWATVEARQNAINETALNVVAFLKGTKRNRVV